MSELKKRVGFEQAIVVQWNAGKGASCEPRGPGHTRH